MSVIVALNPVTGEIQYLAAAGDPSDSQHGATMLRADTTAHSKLDELKQTVSAGNTAWLPQTYDQAAAFRVVKNSAGKLKSFYFHNNNQNTTFYLMFFNRTNAPTPSATDFVLCPIPVFPGQEKAIGSQIFGPDGVSFSIGIVYAFSTNRDQYVAITTLPSDIRAFVMYQ